MIAFGLLVSLTLMLYHVRMMNVELHLMCRSRLHNVWCEHAGVNLLQRLARVYPLLLLCVVYQSPSVVRTYVYLNPILRRFSTVVCRLSVDK